MKKMMHIFIAGFTTVFLTLDAAAQQNPATQNDTLCISSAATNNRIIINEEDITRLNECTDSLAVKGEIVQNGPNNSIQINIGGEAPKYKRQKTINKSQTISKIQTTKSKLSTCSKTASFTIKQIGKNNSVKNNLQLAISFNYKLFERNQL